MCWSQRRWGEPQSAPGTEPLSRGCPVTVRTESRRLPYIKFSALLTAFTLLQAAAACGPQRSIICWDNTRGSGYAQPDWALGISRSLSCMINCHCSLRTVSGCSIRRVRKVANSDYELHYVSQSTCRHETTWLPLHGLSWYFTMGTFIKICRETSNFVKIGQKYEVLYMDA